MKNQVYTFFSLVTYLRAQSKLTYNLNLKPCLVSPLIFQPGCVLSLALLGPQIYFLCVFT